MQHLCSIDCDNLAIPAKKRMSTSFEWVQGFDYARAAMRSILFACVLAASSIAVAADNEVRVSADTEGAAVHVEAIAILRAPLALVWQTLTDYDHLSTFVPGMKKSRVVDRRGVAAIIEETGEARFLLFSYPIDVTVSSEEYPPHSIRVHALKGNLKKLDGGYEIVPLDGGEIRLTWRGVIEPDIFLPVFVTKPLLRSVVEMQFRGMVAEIGRRSALQNP
jgi:ribosome-associated toxin RatA of RatAB toxin-antitoxin module